ncbi:hypothetical protein K488DRAFT_91802, partial [Vararia minispora EC-137]
MPQEHFYGFLVSSTPTVPSATHARSYFFISAYMLASKIICDDTYSNKSWCIVAQHMFQLREINQMEREMCSYLEWQLNVDPDVLREFQARVKHDFAGPGPYPPLVLPQDVAPAPAAP